MDESELRALLEAERAYLDSLIADSDTYFNRLVALDAIERKLLQETEKLAAYIDERVLWIRSAAPLSTDDLPRLWQAGSWMMDFENWCAAALALWTAWHESQFAGTLLTAAIVVLIVLQSGIAPANRSGGQAGQSAVYADHSADHSGRRRDSRPGGRVAACTRFSGMGAEWVAARICPSVGRWFANCRGRLLSLGNAAPGSSTIRHRSGSLSVASRATRRNTTKAPLAHAFWAALGSGRIDDSGAIQ